MFKSSSSEAVIFVPRTHLTSAIEAWRAESEHACFVIVGSPGTGKTALARDLIRRLEFDAWHCCDANNAKSTNPHLFVESISRQLASDEVFRDALRELSSQRREMHLQVNVQQTVGTASGSVTGVEIKLGDISAEDAFQEVVLRPLELAATRTGGRTRFLLIDAIDESKAYGGKTSIATLLERTACSFSGAKLVLTTRPDDFSERRFLDGGARLFSLDRDYPLELRNAELTAVIRAALEASPELRAKLEQTIGIASAATLGAQHANGNFLLASFMAPMLRALPGPITPESLRALPPDIPAVYLSFLDRMCPDARRWADLFRPLLGSLAVAQEALSEAQLASIMETTSDEVRTRLIEAQQFVRELDDLDGESRWEIYHRSFADFILSSEAARAYWCEPSSQHKRLLRQCRRALEPGKHEGSAVDYALDHVITHAVSSGAGAAGQIEDLFKSRFLPAKTRRRDLRAVLLDIRMALRFLFESQASLRIVVLSAVLYATWRDRLAQRAAPPLIPILVKLGRVDQARQLIAELDATSEQFFTEAESARNALIESVAEMSDSAAVAEIVGTLDEREQRKCVDVAASVLAGRNPAEARSLLERTGYAEASVSEKTCAALARNPEYLDFALARAGSPSSIAAIAEEAAAYDVDRALELATGLETSMPHAYVAGIRVYPGPDMTMSAIARRVARADPARGYRITELIGDVRQQRISRTLIASSLYPTEPSMLDACLASLRGAQHALASACLLMRGWRGESPTAIEARLVGNLDWSLDELLVMAPELDFEGLARDREAARVMSALGRGLASVVRAGGAPGLLDPAFEWIARWLATFSWPDALDFAVWTKANWSQGAPLHDIAKGIAAALATRGSEAVSAAFKANAFLVSHVALMSAIEVIAARDFRDACRLIASVDPQYVVTRGAMIGATARHVAAGARVELEALLGLMPKYIDSATFLDLQSKMGAAMDELTRMDIPVEISTAASRLKMIARLLRAHANAPSSAEALRLLQRAVEALVETSDYGGYPVDPCLGVLDPKTLWPEALLALAAHDALDVPRFAIRCAQFNDRRFLCRVIAGFVQRTGQDSADEVQSLIADRSCRSSASPNRDLPDVLLEAILEGVEPLSSGSEPVESTPQNRLMEIARIRRLTKHSPDRLVEELASTFPDTADEYIAFECRLNVARTMLVVAHTDPQVALQALESAFARPKLWLDVEQWLEELLAEVSAKSPQRALRLAQGIYAGDEPRTRYLRSCCMRAVALGLVPHDWQTALEIVESIEDWSVRGLALGRILEQRLAAAEPIQDDELEAFILLADVQEEDRRYGIFGTLLAKDAKRHGWNDATLAQVVYRIAMGNRSTFQKLVGRLFFWLGNLRPEVISAFDLANFRTQLAE